jgi:hypothetical protein
MVVVVVAAFLTSNQFERKLLCVVMQLRSSGLNVNVTPSRVDGVQYVAGSQETSLTPLGFAHLPVVYIMGHSCYDVVFEESMQNDHTVSVSLKGARTITLPRLCLSVSATPVGALGLVFEDCANEVDESIVNMTGAGFKQWLVASDDLPCMSLHAGRKPRGFVPVASFNSECTETVDKEFEFFGDTLAGGGFGVVKLENDESLASVIDSGGLGRDHIYNDMSRTPGLYRLVREAARTETPIPLEVIVAAIGPGIYVSCACSNVQVYIKRVRSLKLTRMPFAAGRPLAVRLYLDAYEHLLSIVRRGNHAWQKWVYSLWGGRCVGSQTTHKPDVECTFVFPDQTDFSPTSGSGALLTRSAAKTLRSSHRGYPALE